MNDRQIIKGIQNNNDLAFRSLINKYKKLVYNTAFRLVKNQADADDIFQDVFLDIYKSCHLIINEDDLTMWIYKIAYNKSISFLRKKNPAKSDISVETTVDSESSIQKQIDKNTPLKRLEQKEAVSILYQLIDKLPDKQKQVLLMHKFEGIPQKKICEQLNLSANSVESLIYRAKKTLKQKLSDFLKLNS